jgi:hypothetical protein
MSKIFLAPLKNILLTDLQEETIELIPGINISNSNAIKQGLLSDQFIEAAGLIETNYIMQSEVFIHYNFDNDEILFQGRDNLNILEILLLWVDDILKNSWLVKDNSVTAETGFLLSAIPGTGNIEGSSMRLQYSLTKASGGVEPTEFTREELNRLIKVHDSIETYLSENDSSSYHFPLYKSINRLGRALTFVKQAREARNLAYKISNYCSALEALLSTDTTELSHRMSERVAFLLQIELPKIETYKMLKKAYSIRSKLTHGASLSQNQVDELSPISIATDDVLRKILNKIHCDKKLSAVFSASSSQLDDFFEGLIFG